MYKRITAAVLAGLMLFMSAGCQDGGGTTPGSNGQGAVNYTSKINVNQLPILSVSDHPAQSWEEEATPMGNGFIGAMIFGGVESDRIQINEHTLWSGGPGADESYNGGMGSGSREENIANLQKAREDLQKTATEFTKNNAAYIKDGEVISSIYPSSDAAKTYIDRLKGDKSAYGSYQSMADLYINEISSVYLVDSHVSGCRNLDISPLTDGSVSTKWFSADGGSWGDMSDTVYPLELIFEYSDTVKASGYSLTSGDDDHDRDPLVWTLSGSADGEGWIELDSRSGVQFDSRQETKEFYFEAGEQSYRYFKLTILENEGGWGTQLSEFTLISDSIGYEYTDYKRALDIDNAVTTVEYQKGGVKYTKEYFVSNPGNFMAIRISSDSAKSINNVIRLTSPQPHANIVSENDRITITGRPSDHREDIDHLEFAGEVRVVSDGEISAQGSSIAVTGADEIIIYFTAGTNYQQCMDDSFDYFSDENPLDAVRDRLSELDGKDYEELKAAHIEDYRSLYARLSLDLGLTELPDKTTEELLRGYKYDILSESEQRYLETVYYQFGRYLLISSSREGSLPANLQGIWADGLYAPWSSDYHTNINIQMNYWLAQTTNLAECHLPVIEYINSLVPRGEITAYLYHCTEDGGEVRGWTTYHENNIWGNTGPATSDAFYFPAAAAWCCQDIWEYYRFTLDKEFLEENFDTLLGASLFWVDNLVTDERDGTLVASPSWSPEHGPYSIGTSCDQGIIWELFDFTVKAAEVLGIETSEIDEIRSAKEKLWLPEIGLSGVYLEWKDENTLDITGDYGHRHVNHLFTLHPGTMVIAGRSDEDDEIVEAMKKVLEIRGDGGTGWSKAWKINFWARLLDGNHAGVMVNQILKESTYENLFDTHPPFQIDGNFGATAGMTEMLIQSHGETISLLPALPDIWADGAASGLRARNDVTVSMSWSGSELKEAELRSGESTGEISVSYPKISGFKVVDSNNNTVKVKKDGKNTIIIDTQPNEVYYICAE